MRAVRNVGSAQRTNRRGFTCDSSHEADRRVEFKHPFVNTSVHMSQRQSLFVQQSRSAYSVLNLLAKPTHPFSALK